MPGSQWVRLQPVPCVLEVRHPVSACPHFCVVSEVHMFASTCVTWYAAMWSQALRGYHGRVCTASYRLCTLHVQSSELSLLFDPKCDTSTNCAQETWWQHKEVYMAPDVMQCGIGVSEPVEASGLSRSCCQYMPRLQQGSHHAQSVEFGFC